MLIYELEMFQRRYAKCNNSMSSFHSRELSETESSSSLYPCPKSAL